MSEADDGGGDELRALLALQDADLRADQLRHQIAHHPARARLAELAARRVATGRERQAADAQRRSLVSTQDELEADIAQTELRQHAIDDRLRSSAAGSFRDQEAMASELGALAKRKAELEDRELEVMEALEPVDATLARLDAADAESVALEAEASAALAAGVSELEAALDDLAPVRTAAAAAVPDALRADYERLRAHLGGIGAARLVRGACSGCNLALAATELDRINHAAPGTVFHCEQCGRILVP